ncbi:MAG: hypothetical protein ABL898_19785 [Hyphomicrobiaceae bacterium]
MPSLLMVNTRATLGLAIVECHVVAGTPLDHGENGEPAGAWHSQLSEPEPMEAPFRPNTTSLPSCSVM